MPSSSRAAEPLLAEQTVAEIVELSQAMRIPAAPVNDGATVLDCPQYAKRGFFVDGGQDFRRPGPPFRFSKTPQRHRYGGTIAPDVAVADARGPCIAFCGAESA